MYKIGRIMNKVIIVGDIVQVKNKPWEECINKKALVIGQDGLQYDLCFYPLEEKDTSAWHDYEDLLFIGRATREVIMQTIISLDEVDEDN